MGGQSSYGNSESASKGGYVCAVRNLEAGVSYAESYKQEADASIILTVLSNCFNK